MASNTITLEELEGKATAPDMSKSVMSPEYKPETQSILPELLGLGGGLLATMTPQGRVLGALGRAGQELAGYAPSAVRPFIPSLFGSSVGTVLGTAAEQALSGEAIPSKFLSNLAENAVWDVGGNLAFNVAGKTFKITKEALTGANATLDQIPDARLAAQRFLSQSSEPGATLTRAELLGTPGARTAETVARGGTGAPIFAAQEQAVKTAVAEGKKNFFEKLDTDPVFQSILSEGRSADYAAGSSFKNAIASGYDALKQEVDPFYKSLSSQGKNIAVDFTPIKKAAQTELDNARAMSETRRAGSALTDEAATELRNVADIKGIINFEQAHQYRSNLLGRIRELESLEVRPTNLIRILKETATSLEKKMDEGAQLFNPALKKEYDIVSKTYREGISELYPQTIIKALKQNPERVGESLFRTGNETEVLDTIKAAARIENLTAKTANPIKRDEILNSLRFGYMGGILSNFDTTAKLAKDLENPKFTKGFNALFPEKAQQEVLTGMAEAARTVKESATSQLAGVTSRSVGAGVQLASLVAGGTAAYLNLTPDVQEKLKENLPASVISGSVILLTPRLMAKAMTDPGAVNALAKVTNPNKTTPAAYGAAITKLAAYWNNAGLFDNDYISKVQQFTGNLVPEGQRQPQPLTPAGTADVIKLEDLQ